MELIRQFTEQVVPFNAWLGVQIHHIEAGDVTVRMPFKAELVGDPFRPALHGGVLAALIDLVGGAAAFTRLGPYDRVSTVDMRVDYLRPARCEDVFARARVLRMGNRVCAVSVSCFHEGAEEEPLSMGMAVYNVRRGHGPVNEP
jgi:uncharacterized protein (TIGR00369 family)